jgi:hypothetical protein
MAPLAKYNGFVAGDRFPAENANSMDPDNLPVSPVDNAYRLVRFDGSGQLRLLEMTAYENLIASDLVKVVNDSGTYKLRKIKGIAASVSNTAITAIDSVLLSDTKVAVLYNNSNVYYVKIGTLSGATITWGTGVTTGIATGGTLPGSGNFAGSIIKIDTDKIAVSGSFYNASGGMYVVAATISGTVPTFGTAVKVSSNANTTAVSSKLVFLSTDKAAVLYFLSTLCSKIVTFSGTTTSAGSEQSSMGSSGTFNVISINSDAFIYTSNLQNINICTVSGTTISTGTGFNVTGTGTSMWLVKTEDDKATFAYTISGSTSLFCGQLTRSGSVLTKVGEITNTSAVTTSGGVATALANLVFHQNFAYYIGDNVALKIAVNGTLVKKITTNWNLEATGYAAGLATTDYILVTKTSTEWVAFLLDHDEFITAINTSYTAGVTAAIVRIFTGFSSLIAGNDYYIKSDGSGLTQDNSYQKVGKAINATTIVN